MELLVLGATGGTGLEIVRQSVARGHSVTAFVRSPDRLMDFQNRISIKQGDLLDTSRLEQVIKGNDAVLSAFGPRLPVSKADAHLLERFAIALSGAMLRADINRVAVESVAFLFKDSIFPPGVPSGQIVVSRHRGGCIDHGERV
jgi:putative NADH-flavin reductase